MSLHPDHTHAGARPALLRPFVAAVVGAAVRGGGAFLLSVTACSGDAPGRAAAKTPTSALDSATPPSDVVLREDARGVATAAVGAAELADYVEVPGRIQADPTRVVRVYAPVSGRLISLHVRPADAVEQGQVLAVLASSDVAAARTAYRQTQADAQVKQQALERSKLLYENHVVALREYQQAQAEARMAAAALESAVERLELLTGRIREVARQREPPVHHRGSPERLGCRRRLRKGCRADQRRRGGGGDDKRVPWRDPSGTRDGNIEHRRYRDAGAQDPRGARQPRPAAQTRHV